MQDRVGALLVGGVGHARAEDHVLGEGDAGSILHGTGVEFGDEELVVLDEGVGNVELPLEEGETLLGQQENVIGVEEFRE